MQVNQEETDMAAWVERQATEASNWLEYVSLQELIIRKSWAGWEEGMRLAHRQQEIGEGENERYRAWRRCYMEQAGDVKGECMDEGVIRLDA